jgi:hypothetical protein
MEGQNENDELYPIAVLIDELKVCGYSVHLSLPLHRWRGSILAQAHSSMS